jgi:O-antigen/teichoic acid export membrane protein
MAHAVFACVLGPQIVKMAPSEPKRRPHEVLGARKNDYRRRDRDQAERDAAHGGRDRYGGSSGGQVSRVTGQDGATALAPEVVVESVPAAMALAPNAVGPNLGAEILLDDQAHPGVESMRAGLLQAGPLAAAGVLANGASVVLTIALARLMVPHSYGVLNQLTGLYLILSMPGSAVVVAVVRRVTIWHEDGSGHLVRRWAGRVHRQGTLLVLAWAAAVFAGRHDIAVVLNQQSGIGIAAILTAAAFFVLLSLDRGLLQSNRSYRPLAGNLLVEMGVRVAAVLLLVLAGFGPSGAAVGVLIGEVVAAVHARWAAVRAWSTDGRPPRRWATRSWLGAMRRDPVLKGAAAERHTVVLDLVVASISLSMVAVLQNVDVLVVGRDSPGRSGAYAAVSVTSKAIVFGAVVLGGYLLPEAAIRWRQGDHALRQLAVVLVLLAVPSGLLFGIGLAAPQVLLELVFHHDYTSAADALAPLVVAMIMLSVSVVLTMYLLAVGRRWVVAVLVAGAAALTVAVLTVHGDPWATALVDLSVQAAVLAVILVGFVLVHRPRLHGRGRRTAELIPIT